MLVLLKKKAKAWLAILITSFVLTFLEWLANEMGRVIYFNGWNIYWTFVSYFLPLASAYGYSKLINKV